MSRTYRRKNEKFHNSLVDYTEDTWWLRWRGIGYLTHADRVHAYNTDKARFYTDSYSYRPGGKNLKYYTTRKSRSFWRIEVSKLNKNHEYEVQYKRWNTYDNVWNWD